MISMPWNSYSAPAFTLEINQSCNIKCKSCYKKLDGSSKPISSLIDELEIGLSQRNIQTVLIAGGEPTLHPNLCEIIKYIRKKNLKAALITNGLLLDESYLNDLAEAGLNVIMYHIDEGQIRPDLPEAPTFQEISELRSEFADRTIRKGIDVGLTTTLRQESIDRLPDLIQFIFDCQSINYLFATNDIDITDIIEKVHNKEKSENVSISKETNNQQILSRLKELLRIEPFSYLKFSQANGDSNIAWMLYVVPILYSDKGYEVFSMKSNVMDKLLLYLTRLLSGNNLFYYKHNQTVIRARLLFNMLGNFNIIENIRFMAKTFSRTSRLKSKALIFENGPIATEDGHLYCCDFCPNGTIRDGKIVSLCLADHVILEDR